MVVGSVDWCAILIWMDWQMWQMNVRVVHKSSSSVVPIRTMGVGQKIRLDVKITDPIHVGGEREREEKRRNANSSAGHETGEEIFFNHHVDPANL